MARGFRVLLGAALLPGSLGFGLRSAGGAELSGPAIVTGDENVQPLFADLVLSSADAQVNVADAATFNSEANSKAMAADQQKLLARLAQEDAEKAVTDARAADEAVEQATNWALEAQKHLFHARQVAADMRVLPELAQAAAKKAVEEEVREIANAAAESAARQVPAAPSKEERLRKVAEKVAAAAEPFHLAELRVEKGAEDLLSRAQQAAAESKRLAEKAMDQAKRAQALQASGHTGEAQRTMAAAHSSMQQSMDERANVPKLYEQYVKLMKSLGPYKQQEQSAAAEAASSAAVEGGSLPAPKLPPLP